MIFNFTVKEFSLHEIALLNALKCYIITIKSCIIHVYKQWIDCFHKLILNNLFFSDTAYDLLGFYKDGYVIYAVVEKTICMATEKTDLANLKKIRE